MATLRQFIRDMTSLPVGSTIRDSIENPKTVGGGEDRLQLFGTVEVEMNTRTVDVDNDLNGLNISLVDRDVNVSIEATEVDIVKDNQITVEL